MYYVIIFSGKPAKRILAFDKPADGPESHHEERANGA